MTSELRALRDRPFELLAALEARLQTAASAGAAGEAQDVWTGLGYRLAGHQLVTPRADVREVLTPPEYTRVPGAKPWLLGIANVRGDLLPLIDLNRLLGGEATAIQRSTRVLVYNADEVPAGFLVDEVAGFRRFNPQDQRHELVPDEGDPLHPYLLGAFVRDGQLWLAMSLSRLVTSPVFQNAAA
ncbi:MAG TPA: chemotaxis protein CheW [Nevskiales bacterium]|nr:chemotaxis protein CheW [Nevskiales bacterium]